MSGPAAPEHRPPSQQPVEAREAKIRLRRDLRARRAEADAGSRAEAAAGFADALEQLLEQHPDGALLAFLPLPHEPPLTSALRDQLARRPVLLPVTQPQRSMLWSRWLPTTEFAPSGPGGLREPLGSREPAPQEIGLVLVPALAVDRSGLRLGMGGGFYDTFLEGLPPGTPAAACVFAREILPDGCVPGEPWDARLPAAVTERGVIDLDG